MHQTEKFALVVAVMAAAAAAAPASRAATLYTLSINDDGSGNLTPNSFAVYADVSGAGGGAGLASFSVDLQNYVTVNNRSPQAQYFNTTPTPTVQNAGFTLVRSAANDDPGGSQDTTNPSAGTTVYVYGFGQSSGNIANSPPRPATASFLTGTDTAYAAHLLLATGTWSGTFPSFVPASATTFANVFDNTSGTTTHADTVTLQGVTVPEPTSAAVGLLLGGAALRRRRDLSR